MSASAVKGQRAGTTDPRGYRKIQIDGKKYYEHRLIWFFLYKKWPAITDHKNRKKGCNRPDNLRDGTQTLNMANRPKQTNNTSGVKQVYWHSRARKWCAQIQINGRATHLGLFTNKKAAGAAYAKAAAHHFGEFARA